MSTDAAPRKISTNARLDRIGSMLAALIQAADFKGPVFDETSSPVSLVRPSSH